MHDRGFSQGHARAPAGRWGVRRRRRVLQCGEKCQFEARAVSAAALYFFRLVGNERARRLFKKNAARLHLALDASASGQNPDLDAGTSHIA